MDVKDTADEFLAKLVGQQDRFEFKRTGKRPDIVALDNLPAEFQTEIPPNLLFCRQS